ncbi:50S ribosomal protein L23 [Candidatus Pacearchaeota archaeon CG_4_9_14_3_um_filter_31_7]|nr:MAG: 50S ribosomal protein L23 [Candidatus Pacearchaeota archaeon CG1_02_31_27]PIN92360.1 MAG: 50S ribosomal protein L23 [Candidatus Pacearchaeota archaeon CG10_big_fil_rev_8_21_14_0_10_31_59]PIZ80662.1 MAG: 50S ribosomal protein L23 [Candidatus Pacearchaeota archaeon CG_4_10_14_0_2_um_filter_31_10]PJA70633.1 MAG: 50S ribosomal protein L23 [Candidatus Pacearchaeota archaeon CG_4_9_14_3_um_filter_31_7]
MRFLLYPITTEKAVKLVEMENKIVFVVEKRAKKEEIKKEIEKEFKVEVENINSQIVKGKKVAFIKLKSKYVASDIATKLGML